jgi:hypothetical protein
MAVAVTVAMTVRLAEKQTMLRFRLDLSDRAAFEEWMSCAFWSTARLH